MRVVQARGIVQFQSFVSYLYPNEERDFSYIYGYCSRHLGFIGKCITQQKQSKEEFVRAIAWLLALANKVDVNVMTSLTKRYPGVCPYCLASSCECRPDRKAPQRDIPAYRIPDELDQLSNILLREHEITFDETVTRLRKIYPGNQATWHTIGGWKLSAKIQEELAEVHEASSRYYAGRKPKEAVAEEFADLFAWTLSAWHLATDGLSLDDEFRAYFMNGCPVCGVSVCECAMFSDAGSQTVEAEKLRNLLEAFKELAEEAGLAEDDLAMVETSLEKAITTQSEPVAVNAVRETKSIVQRIETGIETGAKNAGNVSKLIVAVKAIWAGLGM